MNTSIRLAAYQGPIVENDFAANLRKVESVLESTRELALDFLCFPETYLSGYSPAAARDASVALADPRLTAFIARTRLYDTVILVGTAERRPAGIFNTQLIIYQGELLGTYSKCMLTEDDRQHFARGMDFPVFHAKGIPFGVVICADTSYVEPALLLRWKGARLLFTPHYNCIPPEGIDTPSGVVTYWEHRTMVLNNQAALAALLKMVVVRSNVVIIGQDGLGSGDAAIWDMNGVQVASGAPFTETVVTADFPREIFLREHWIDRREIPIELVDMIAQAAKKYK